jgi:hypothetical protein
MFGGSCQGQEAFLHIQHTNLICLILEELQIEFLIWPLEACTLYYGEQMGVASEQRD